MTFIAVDILSSHTPLFLQQLNMALTAAKSDFEKAHFNTWVRPQQEPPSQITHFLVAKCKRRG